MLPCCSSNEVANYLIKSSHFYALLERYKDMINIFVVFSVIFVAFVIFRVNLLLDPFNPMDDIAKDMVSQSCELVDLSPNIFPLGNSEDMEVLNSRLLILSNFPYADIFRSNYTSTNPKYFPLVLFDLSSKVASPLKIVGYPPEKELRSHGISIDKNSLTLAVVNHAIGEGESTVEIFRMELFQFATDAEEACSFSAGAHSDTGACQLVPESTLESAVSVVAHYIGSTNGFYTGSINDVVLVKNDTMYVTEFTKAVLRRGEASPTAVSVVVQEVSMLLGVSMYSIQKCVAPRYTSHFTSSTAQWKCNSFISLPPLNGISVTSDKSILVVVSPGLKSLLFYSTENPHVLTPVAKSRVPLVLDNIVLAEEECGVNQNGELVDVWYGAGVLRGLDYVSYVTREYNENDKDFPSGQLRIEFNHYTRNISYSIIRQSSVGCFSVSAKLAHKSKPGSLHMGPTALGSFCSSGIYLCD